MTKDFCNDAKRERIARTLKFLVEENYLPSHHLPHLQTNFNLNSFVRVCVREREHYDYADHFFKDSLLIFLLEIDFVNFLIIIFQ